MKDTLKEFGKIFGLQRNSVQINEKFKKEKLMVLNI